MIIKNLSFSIAVGLGLMSLAGCATMGGSDRQAAALDLTPIVGHPVTARGQLVLACVRRALADDTFDMVAEQDGENRRVRFTCSGGPAQTLFDALAERSAAVGSEWQGGAATYRSTERIERDLYGADICWRDAGSYVCQFNLNLGGFIRD